MRKRGIRTLDALLFAQPTDLLRILNFGSKTMEDVARVVQQASQFLEPDELTRYQDPLRSWEPFLKNARATQCKQQATENDEKGQPNIRPSAPIEELSLSVRARNGLLELGITILDGLLLAQPADLLMIPNFGSKTMENIARVVQHALQSLEPDELAHYEDSLRRWRPYFLRTPRLPPAPEAQSARKVADLIADESPAPPKTLSARPDLYVAVSDLPLSVRARNCLVRAGVKTLHELALVDPERVRRWKNLGKTTLCELAGTLQAFLGSFDPEVLDFYYMHGKKWLALPSESQASKEPSRQDDRLLDVVQAFLTAQSERNRQIILRRFGLGDGRVHTLEAIGRRHGLTRERIRQIAAKAHDRLARRIRLRCHNLLPILSSHMYTSVVGTLRELVCALPELGGSIQLDAEACVRLWLLGIPEQVHPLDRARRLWTTCDWLDDEEYRRVLEYAGEELKGVPRAIRQVSLRVASDLGRSDDTEVQIIELALRNSLGTFTVHEERGIELLVPVDQNLQDKRRAFAYGYIREQGVPIKATEIFDAMSEIQPELVPSSATQQAQVHALKGLLERDDRFSWAGLSTFGLREWGYESGVTSIGQAALALLRAANQPLSAQEIYNTLKQLYLVAGGSVNAALSSMGGASVAKDGSGRWYALR